MGLCKKIVYLIAFVHLCITILFAAHFAAWCPRNYKIVNALETVGNYTGSNNIFSFFAPELSNQPYVIYTIQDDKGKEKVIDFTSKSPDFTNRINDIYGYLTIKESRTILSACLAQSVLKKYPEAKKIKVTMVVQYIPTMQAFTKGARSQWRFWFNTDFDCNGKALSSK
jgi:hypothetical protein